MPGRPAAVSRSLPTTELPLGEGIINAVSQRERERET